MLLTGLGTHQLVFETSDHLPLAQRKLLVLATATLKLFTVDGAGEVDGHDVLLLGLALHFLIRGLLAAQIVDHLVDVLIQNFRIRLLDADLAQITQLNFRHDLENGNKFKVLAFFHGLRLKPRLARRLHVLLLDCLHPGIAHHFAENFLAYALAKALAHHLHRDLARAEAVETDLFRGFAQAFINLLLNVRRGHANRHATLNVGGRFKGDLHGISSVIAVPIQCKAGDHRNVSATWQGRGVRGADSITFWPRTPRGNNHREEGSGAKGETRTLTGCPTGT